MPKRLLVRVDGGCQPNPGHGASAAVAYNLDDMTKALSTDSIYLGPDATSNTAEHSAIVLALRVARFHGASEVTIESDSTLAVNHFNKKWEVQGKRLRPLVEQEWALAKRFSKVVIKWVPREKISEAHFVVQEELESKKGIPVKKRETGKDKVFADVEEFLRRKGVPILNRTHFALWVPNSAIVPVPYYTEREPLNVIPTVDEAFWSDALKLMSLQPTIIAWRPYGNNVVPRAVDSIQLQVARPLREQRDGGVELMFAFADGLALAETTGNVGYSGSRIRYLSGGPWLPAREFAWFTNGD